MPPADGNDAEQDTPDDAQTDNPEPGRAGKLIRYSHIFASAVREILEVGLLREVCPVSLTLSQFQLLKVMSRNGRHQLGDVAGFLGVTPPAATKNIDKLERLGLVVRTPSKGDRRATLLSVSPKGRRLVRKFEDRKAERLLPILETFEPDELEQFSQLLKRFSVSLLDAEPSDGGICLRCAAYIEDGCPVSVNRGGCPYQQVHQARAAKGAADRVS